VERFFINLSARPASSEIIVVRGWPVSLLPDRGGRSLSAVFTQAGALDVAREVSELTSGAPVMELPDRDEAKSLEIAEKGYQWLAGLQLGRHDTVLGVGGGAVTDTAGFIGATWLRGVEVVLVPTTLLGAVDAAIGGKTGINLAGKNLVGAFHLPSRVVINLKVLDQVPYELRLEGTAEALKAGLVGDPKLVEVYESHGLAAPLDEVVPKAVAVKVDVVNNDYREDGRRAILNFGHTIGHAVEIAGAMPHGFAVAVGMVAAGAVSSAKYGFSNDWLTNLIGNLGLPVSVDGVSADLVFELIGRDKKRSAGGTRMVLLRAVGDPVVEVVGHDDVMLGMRAVGIGE
jgi:3-dehydroquinate synthetase